MDTPHLERRKHGRYDTELEVAFKVAYHLKTIVKFWMAGDGKSATQKYSAVSRNISTEGLCFVSAQKLETGDILLLEVYSPTRKEAIVMKGEVRWSQVNPAVRSDHPQYNTGIQLLTIRGKSVRSTIYHDAQNKVTWSGVLEAIFGSPQKFRQREHHLSL